MRPRRHRRYKVHSSLIVLCCVVLCCVVVLRIVVQDVFNGNLPDIFDFLHK